MDGIHDFPSGKARRPLERITYPRLQGLKVFELNNKNLLHFDITANPHSL
jgi:hypothetical protein